MTSLDDLYVGWFYPPNKKEWMRLCTLIPVLVYGNCSYLDVGVGGNWSWSSDEAAPGEVLFHKLLSNGKTP